MSLIFAQMEAARIDKCLADQCIAAGNRTVALLRAESKRKPVEITLHGELATNQATLDLICGNPDSWTEEQIQTLKYSEYSYLLKLAEAIKYRLLNLDGYQRFNTLKRAFEKQPTEELQQWRRKFNNNLYAKVRENCAYFLYLYEIGSDEYIVDQILLKRGTKPEIPFTEYGLFC